MDPTGRIRDTELPDYGYLIRRAGLTLQPMEWPGKKTRDRRNSPFRTEWKKTCDLLAKELNAIGANNRILQIEIERGMMRLDGLPRADSKLKDQGVIVSFRTKAGDISMPCDTYWYLEDNVRAIALSLEALRAVDRYGVTRNSEQYRGWTAIPAEHKNGFKSADEAFRFVLQVSGAVHQARAAGYGQP